MAVLHLTKEKFCKRGVGVGHTGIGRLLGDLVRPLPDGGTNCGRNRR